MADRRVSEPHPGERDFDRGRPRWQGEAVTAERLIRVVVAAVLFNILAMFIIVALRGHADHVLLQQENANNQITRTVSAQIFKELEAHRMRNEAIHSYLQSFITCIVTPPTPPLPPDKPKAISRFVADCKTLAVKAEHKAKIPGHRKAVHLDGGG